MVVALSSPSGSVRSSGTTSLSHTSANGSGLLLHLRPVHRAIAALSPGDRLDVRVGSGRWELLDFNGALVGQLAGGFEAPDDIGCGFATVLAIATWDRERSEPQYQDGLQCDKWEVVVPELVFEPDSNLLTHVEGLPAARPPP